jgi:hypothetical protein
MRPGCLRSGQRIGWAPVRETGMPRPAAEIWLTGLNWSGDEEPPADYCPDCRVILLPVPEERENAVDRLKKKLEQLSERQKEHRTVREQEKEEKRREERRRKDPWEV